MLPSFSGLSSRARSMVIPSFTRHSIAYSPKHGCIIAQTDIIPHPMMGSFSSTTVQPDLELRLGLVSQGTSTSYKVATTNKVSKGKGIIRSNICLLTLGHRNWAKTYRKRRRLGRTRRQTNQTQVQLAPIKVGPNQATKKKRDYYGPCVRCGKTFLLSQAYASHMRVHYILEDTEEEKKERLAKKRRK